jgi:hypothetical protein
MSASVQDAEDAVRGRRSDRGVALQASTAGARYGLGSIPWKDYESGNRETADLQEFLNLLVRRITWISIAMGFHSSPPCEAFWCSRDPGSPEEGPTGASR